MQLVTVAGMYLTSNISSAGDGARYEPLHLPNADQAGGFDALSSQADAAVALTNKAYVDSDVNMLLTKVGFLHVSRCLLPFASAWA